MSQRDTLLAGIASASERLGIEPKSFSARVSLSELEEHLDELEDKLEEKGNMNNSKSAKGGTDTSGDKNSEITASAESLKVESLATFEYMDNGTKKRLVKNDSRPIPAKEARAAIKAGVAKEIKG